MTEGQQRAALRAELDHIARTLDFYELMRVGGHDVPDSAYSDAIERRKIAESKLDALCSGR